MMRIYFLLLFFSCSTTAPEWEGADRNLLFIGNSLTYTNNLPEMVSVLANAATGEQIAVASVCFPNYSLEDLWLEGSALAALKKHSFETVIMQQGPSATGLNPEHLAQWSASWNREVKKYNATTTLYMVWPSSDRLFDLDGVIQSYSNAAEVSGSALAPVGKIWKTIWAQKPSADLYGADGFHPSITGTWVAAITMVCTHFKVPPDSVPSTFKMNGTTVIIDSEIAEITRNFLREN